MYSYLKLFFLSLGLFLSIWVKAEDIESPISVRVVAMSQNGNDESSLKTIRDLVSLSQTDPCFNKFYSYAQDVASRLKTDSRLLELTKKYGPAKANIYYKKSDSTEVSVVISFANNIEYIKYDPWWNKFYNALVYKGSKVIGNKSPDLKKCENNLSEAIEEAHAKLNMKVEDPRSALNKMKQKYEQDSIFMERLRLRQQLRPESTVVQSNSAALVPATRTASDTNK